MIVSQCHVLPITVTVAFTHKPPPVTQTKCFQGKIACANVLSDLYAMGVTDCDNMLMLLGLSEKLTNRERDIVTPLVIKGFNGIYV